MFMTNPNNLGVLIVGAGISGLTLARRLSNAGEIVTVFEKSKGVGGRLATRRGSGLLWDHGTQSLNPKDLPVETWIDWERLKILIPRKDGRDINLICPQGMTQLPKALAIGITVHRNSHIKMIRVGPGGKVWMIGDDAGGWHYGNRLVLAIPAPQALLLLDGSFPSQLVSLKDRLREICYRPTLTVLATLSRKQKIDKMIKKVVPIESLTENGEKGMKDSLGALTIHLNEKYSLKHFDSPEEEVLTEIKQIVKKKLGLDILNLVLKRWRYSQVTHPLQEPFLAAKLTSPLYVMGDGFSGGGIKGALHSANTLALELIKSVTKEARENGKEKKGGEAHSFK